MQLLTHPTAWTFNLNRSRPKKALGDARFELSKRLKSNMCYLERIKVCNLKLPYPRPKKASYDTRIKHNLHCQNVHLTSQSD